MDQHSSVPVCLALFECRWTSITPEGQPPPDRAQHTATSIGDAIAIFGGVSIPDNNDLNDMYYLHKEGDSWSWSHPTGTQLVRRP